MKALTWILPLLWAATAWAQSPGPTRQVDPDQQKIIQSDRPDGRFLSTRGTLQHILKHQRPKLAYDPAFTPAQLRQWQGRVREKLAELLRFPQVPPQPAPKRLSSQPRPGYDLEKWELYPQPGSVIRVLVLIPDGVTDRAPAAAVLCYPGTGGSKENLAGEPELKPEYAGHPERMSRNRMALYYAQHGYVAVAMDNPGSGELSDIDYGVSRDYGWEIFTRYLIDLGWSYGGYSAFQGSRILGWMRVCGFVDRNRIAVSGHSLGTFPMVALAIVEPDIKAVVYNDFFCNWITREIVKTKPTAEGARPFPSPWQSCVPDMWEWFDYSDLLACLAPMPVIVTEGGVTRDLERIKAAYHVLGADRNFTWHYYAKYAAPESRHDSQDIPEGLDQEEYFAWANVDAPNHAFEAEVALPWLARVMPPGRALLPDSSPAPGP